MAINPNIALGVQPIQQQPNMLAQYAQVMAIKAAQQEMEGNEGIRGALSQGVPDDPTTLLQYGKQGRATYESLIRGRKEQLDSAEKRLTLTGQIAGYVRDNPTPENFVSAVSTMVQNGVLTRAQAERVIADAGNDPTKIKSYATQAASSAVTEADKMRDKTSRENNAATVGASYYSSNVSRDNSLRTDTRAREQMEFDKNKRNVIPGDNQFLQTDAYGNVYPVAQYGATRGPNAPAPAMPPAAANAFVTTKPSVNALAPIAPPQVVPGSPTRANAAAIEAQQNIPKPRQSFTAPVPVLNKDGNTVLMQGREAVQTGATPATPATEARAATLRKLPDVIAQSRDALNLIDKMIGTDDGKVKPHKGFKGAVGVGMGLRFIPGTSEKDFQAMHEQITGGAFLEAFKTLKGGGQITEKEGEKATAAITRMNLALSEKEYIDAAREFQEIVRRGIRTAEKELKSGPGGGGGASADPLGIR
jgi:hypothetical protein